MTPRAFVPSVCVPLAVMVIACGMSSEPIAQMLIGLAGTVCLAASAILAISDSAARPYAVPAFLAMLWSSTVVVVVRLVLQ